MGFTAYEVGANQTR